MDSFVFYCKGHPNVLATHKSTLEFTKDENLTLKGNCIIGVSSTHSLSELSVELRKKIKDSSTIILVKLQTGNHTDYIKGSGNSDLDLSDENAIIIRRSDFVCSRTLMINANKAARDIDERIIKEMRNPNNDMKVTVQMLEL